MKIINDIDENFIEKMETEKIAVRISDELLEKLEELGITWDTGRKPTEWNEWRQYIEPYIVMKDRMIDYIIQKRYIVEDGYILYEYQGEQNMKVINYIDEKFIERMKKEKIAIKASAELMKRFQELGIKWRTGDSVTKREWWKHYRETQFVDFYFDDTHFLGYAREQFYVTNGCELYEYQPLPNENEKQLGE